MSAHLRAIAGENSRNVEPVSERDIAAVPIAVNISGKA